MYGVFAATACFHNLYTLVKNVVTLDKVSSVHDDGDDDDDAGHRPPDEHGVPVRDAGLQPGQLELAGGLPRHPHSAGHHTNPLQYLQSNIFHFLVCKLRRAPITVSLSVCLLPDAGSVCEGELADDNSFWVGALSDITKAKNDFMK